MYFIKANFSGKTRQETYQGRTYTVVPVVALKQQVLKCSTCPNPEFVPATAFQPAASWNGRPVTLDHPHTEDGGMISAGSPQTMEKFAIGFMFNTTVHGDTLKTEAWIDNERVKSLGAEGDDLMARLHDPEDKIEVSTGYFANIIQQKGRHNTDDYAGVQTDLRPDHLAILPKGTKGACSWEDGCGIRMNSRDDIHTNHDDCHCGGECAQCEEALKAYAEGKYGDVAYADEKNKKYPIDTVEHIRAAWNYINMPKNQKGYTSAEVAHIKSKIIAAWKAKIDSKGPPSARGNSAELAEQVLNFLSEHSPKALLRLLTSTQPDEETTMETPEQKAAREKTERDNARKAECIKTLKALKGKDGKPAYTDEKLNAMSLEALEAMCDVAGQMNAGGSDGLADEDPSHDKGPNDKQNAGQGDPDDPEDDDADDTGTESGKGKSKKNRQSLQDYLRGAPREIVNMYESFTQKDNARKDFLVNQLKANKTHALTEEALKALSLEALEAMYKLATPARQDFSGRPAPRGNMGEVTGGEEAFTPPPTQSFTDAIKANAKDSRIGRFVFNPQSDSKH